MDEMEQMQLMMNTGKHLREIRTEQGRTLAEISEKLGVSTVYLSEVERGKKMPSDHLITQIAKSYSMLEDDLFFMFGKVPLVSRDEFSKSRTIQNTLAEIARHSKLSDDDKENIYTELHKVYKQMIEKHGKD